MNDKEALLNQLRDVELPVVSNMPAPGWWILLLLLLLGLIALFFLRKRRSSRLWQRQAQEQLQAIRSSAGREPSVATLSRCSELARQVVLAVDQRERVSHLHGEAWLAKLDDICARPEFSQGIGQLLLDQPYQKQPLVAKQDLDALFDSMQVLVNSAGRYRPKRS